MTVREDFVERHPDVPLLEVGACEEVARALRSIGAIAPGEIVTSCERAGEGNMNLTLRARTERHSVIVKQARPWVEKYPTIEAPWDRVLVERDFYSRVSEVPQVAEHMPRLVGCLEHARILVLEDLGCAQDLSSLYRGDRLTSDEAARLGQFLLALHSVTRGDSRSGLENREMRSLNAEHIFVVPFVEDNGVDLEALESGLSAAARALREDTKVRQEVEGLRRRYLEDGPALVHGDYFPGSWMRATDGVRIIDPEFGHFGLPELDVGVALGHLCLARQGRVVVEQFLEAANVDALDAGLTSRLAGVEIIRRILGVAQLPIAPSRELRVALLELARSAVAAGSMSELMTGVGNDVD